jgi:hypothetical protein
MLTRYIEFTAGAGEITAAHHAAGADEQDLV